MRRSIICNICNTAFFRLTVENRTWWWWWLRQTFSVLLCVLQDIGPRKLGALLPSFLTCFRELPWNLNRQAWWESRVGSELWNDWASQPLTLLADSTDCHTQHAWVQIPAQPLLTVSYRVRHLTHSSLSLLNCQMGTILPRAHICLGHYVMDLSLPKVHAMSGCH